MYRRTQLFVKVIYLRFMLMEHPLFYGLQLIWLTNPTDSITTAQLATDATIYVDLTNICGTVSDSIQISVISINPTIVSDTAICPGGYANLWAAGGDYYNWYPAGHYQTLQKAQQ